MAPPRIHHVLVGGALLALVCACSETSSPPSTPAPDLTIIEGDTGFFYRAGRECFGVDADPIDADDLWIAPDGDDDDDGTSEGAAFATLARALCNAAPGQTIHVAPGVYKQSVILAQHGDAEAPVTIVGEAGDDGPPVFDGDGWMTEGIGLIETHGFVVEGLQFRNYTDTGLLVALSDEIQLRDNVFSENGFESIDPGSGGEGFGVNVLDSVQVVIEGNESWGNGPNAAVYATGTLGTAINTYRMFDAVVQGNTCRDNTGGGILIEDGERVVVRDNDIYGNHLDANGSYWDGGIWIDGGYDVAVEGNFIHDNLGPALEVSDADKKYPFATCGYRVASNTITGNYWSYYLNNFGQCPRPAEHIVTFEDNDTSDNAYPGDLADWTDGTNPDGSLCLEWPCGEEQPCTEDDFDTSVARCAPE